MHGQRQADSAQAEITESGKKQNTSKRRASSNGPQESFGAFQNRVATPDPSPPGSVDQSPSSASITASSTDSLLSTITEGISTFDSLLELYDSLLNGEPIVTPVEVTASSEPSTTGLDDEAEHASDAEADGGGDEIISESLLAILGDAIQTMDSLISVYDSMLEGK